MRPLLLLAIAALSAASLSACLSTDISVSMVAHPAVDRPATVDSAAAVAMVNAFREGRGLPPVVLDPKLTAIAAAHASAMAARDKVAHVLPGEGSFDARLQAGGFAAAVAVEDIGAGYHDLNEAFSGWRASPPHRDNMLRKGVTRMGIAVAYSPTSKFRDFWSLVLAVPDDKTAGGSR
jgi:uncharacterized protein YkwD